MTRRILPILFLGASTILCRADGPGPSFDCRRAQTPDEVAICADPRLSELDRIYARDFKVLREKDRKQAIEQGRDFMKFRRLCGNDRYCILERMQYMPGGSKTPAWLTDAFKAQYAKDVEKDDLKPRAYAAIGVTGSRHRQNDQNHGRVLQRNRAGSMRSELVASIAPKLADRRQAAYGRKEREGAGYSGTNTTGLPCSHAPESSA